MSRVFMLGAIVVALTAICGCKGPQPAAEPFVDRDKPLPPGELALRKIPREQYPDFAPAYSNRDGVEQAVDRSINYLSKKSSEKYFPYGDVSHTRALASLRHFKSVLREAKSPQEFDTRIKDEFEVYQSVGYDDRGTVWFTGYYTPIFEGRKTRDARFRYPLYRVPKDLVKTDDEGMSAGRMKPDGTLEPKYYTRKEIDQQRLLDGSELAFLSDPFEAYVISVQGSGKLRMADGSLYELGYAANNGHDYVSPGQAMVKDGVLKKSDLSLQTLIRWFKDHPNYAYSYIWKNPRMVFFKEVGGGPFGCLGEPVTPMRSIATDKAIFPRACVAFVRSNNMPSDRSGKIENVPYSGFVLDQDRGNAIRAAGRCDVFMGIGAPAEALAGRTGADGGLYYIFIREDGGRLADAR